MGPAGPKGSRVSKHLIYLKMNYKKLWNKRRNKSENKPEQDSNPQPLTS